MGGCPGIAGKPVSFGLCHGLFLASTLSSVPFALSVLIPGGLHEAIAILVYALDVV